jgi:NhaP-type Na+/H+ or K+/H+ antiporter
MSASGIAILAALTFGYAIASRRLSTTPVTGPMLFAVAGVILGPRLLGFVDADLSDGVIRVLLEVTLALVLFNDATEVPPSTLRDEVPIAGRLLGIGLPLTIVFGVVTAALLLTDLSLAEAAIVGVVLAPTDAALGQAVVGNERVPARIRHALTVESGLNDGLVVPVFGLAVAWAEVELESGGSILAEFAADLGIAVVVGATLGWVGGRVVVAASQRQWVGTTWRAVAPAALALCCFAAAEWLGASGFIAAFVGGVAFGAHTCDRFPEIVVFSDGAGHLMTMLSFFVFGAAILSPALDDLSVGIVVYAVLSLTVLRILPVAVSLVGSGLGRQTVSYLAWFGPRGLASIVFASILVIETDLPGAETISLVMAAAVTLSIALHGATAWLGSNAYADWWQAMEMVQPGMVEGGPVANPVRRSRLEM